MRRTVALVLALTAAGCSGVEDKPSTSRLQAGQVVIMAPLGQAVAIDPLPIVPSQAKSDFDRRPRLLAGDLAKVITDEDKVIGFHRPVRCMVLESSPKLPGKSLAGTECLITRGELRPITKQE